MFEREKRWNEFEHWVVQRCTCGIARSKQFFQFSLKKHGTIGTLEQMPLWQCVFDHVYLYNQRLSCVLYCSIFLLYCSSFLKTQNNRDMLTLRNFVVLSCASREFLINRLPRWYDRSLIKKIIKMKFVWVKRKLSFEIK